MTVYHVSVAGNDSNDGKSEASPKRSIASAVAVAVSGDAILLERNGYWYESISLTTMRGQGSLPITFGAYGSGRMPKVSNYKFAKSDGWENYPSGSNYWRINLKDTSKFVGNQDVSSSTCANVGFLRVDGVIYSAKKWSNLVTPAIYSQWDFWSEQTSDNPSGGWLYVYSVGSPATKAASIAIAVGRRLFAYSGSATGVTGVFVSGIDFVGCAGHFIGDSAQYVEVVGCKIHELGGGQLYGTTRYGNGVQAGYNSRSVNVHHNWIYDVYDTATTCQGNSYSVSLLGWKDIQFHHNWIYRCEQAFELYAMDEPGSGAAGTVATVAAATPGAVASLTISADGTEFYAGQVLRIVGASSGASNATATVSSVGAGGSIASLTLLSAGSGYTHGESVAFTAISWALDSSKGLTNVSFNNNEIFGIGYSNFHATRPDTGVGSPFLIYSVDALTVDVKIYGNSVYDFRGALICSGSGDTLESVSAKGYKFSKNFVFARQDQKLCNLQDYTASEYADWAEFNEFTGDDIVHTVTEATTALASTTLLKLTDMAALSASASNLIRDMVLSIASEFGRLTGGLTSVEQRLIFGGDSPTLTAKFAGQLFFDYNHRKLWVALDLSGGLGSWKRLGDVVIGTGAPTYAATAAGEFYMDDSTKCMYFSAYEGDGASAWRKLPTVVEVGGPPGLTTPEFRGRFLIDTGSKNGYMAVGTASGDYKLITSYKSTVPSSPSSPGIIGQFSVDGNYFYAYVGTRWDRYGRDTSWTS